MLKRILWLLCLSAFIRGETGGRQARASPTQLFFTGAEGKHSMHVLQGGTSSSSDRSFLLIHGSNPATQFAEFWEPHFDFFASMGTFYAVSLPGHGRAKAGPDLNRQVDSVKLIEQLIQELNIKRLFIVGRSSGGVLAVSLVNSLPEGIVHGSWFFGCLYPTFGLICGF